MRLSSGSSSSSSRPRALLLLCPLLLTVIFVASKTCDARNLRSARLSTAAAASLGMPLPAADAKSTKPAPTLLFTLQSDAAFLQLGEAGDPDPDLGKLTLEGVAPTAVWFSERPDRRAGVLPTATLASAALDIVATDDDEERIRRSLFRRRGSPPSASSNVAGSSQRSSDGNFGERGHGEQFVFLKKRERERSLKEAEKRISPRPPQKKLFHLKGDGCPHRPRQTKLRREGPNDDR